jgi:hypothetical protein
MLLPNNLVGLIANDILYLPSGLAWEQKPFRYLRVTICRNLYYSASKSTGTLGPAPQLSTFLIILQNL